PVGLLHPIERGGLQAPEGVDQPLLAMPSPLAAVVAALDTDRDPGRALVGIVPGVGTKAALLPGQEDVGPARSPRVAELPAPEDPRHKEGARALLEIADDPHAVEAAIQQQQAAADADRGGLAEQP